MYWENLEYERTYKILDYGISIIIIIIKNYLFNIFFKKEIHDEIVETASWRSLFLLDGGSSILF